MPWKPGDPRQKEAQRRYYQRNKQKYLDYARATQERYKEIVRALKEHPCTDCGVEYPYYVMDFDHRPGEKKEYEIARIHFWKSRAIIDREVAKCDLVCSNCHRERSYQRQRAKKEPDTATKNLSD